MPQEPPRLSEREAQVILGQPTGSTTGTNNAALSDMLIHGDYEAVLQSCAAKSLFGTELDASLANSVCVDGCTSPFEDEFAVDDIKPFIKTLVDRFILENGNQAWEQITWVATACLCAFIQTNWTGPELTLDPAALLPRSLSSRWSESYIAASGLADLPENASTHEIGRRQQIGRVYLGASQSTERNKLDQGILKLLEYDGEEAYVLTPRPLYLYLARLLLVDIPAEDKHSSTRSTVIPSAHWLAARLLTIQQSLLDYPSQTLMNEILDEYRKVSQFLPDSPANQQTAQSNESVNFEQAVPGIDSDVPDFGAGDANASDKQGGSDANNKAAWESLPVDARKLWTRYLIEIGIVYSQHNMPIDSKKYVSQAQAASGLEWEITGAKGKRTKFQTFDITQLVLVAKSAQQPMDVQGGAIPENFALNDDTLLEQIKLTDPSAEITGQGKLQTIDQCILLAFCLNVRNENPGHGLTSEQMMPFATRVLEQPSNWSVYTMGLLLRSQLEAENSRTSQRAALQLQELVDQISHPLPGTQEAGTAERLSYFSALSLPSQWDLERQLAERFMSLGVIRSALDIFERLELWDDVVMCYVALGQTEVAERIIREQLEKRPDRPKLWCVLGDLKTDPEHWRHAWEVSGQKFARAMRSLGSYHYKRHEYKEAIECYQMALRLNPLFESSWYVLGCAAMALKEWDVAIPAFRRVISIETDNGEAYTNLASAYLNMGNENNERAWNVLREAVKHMRNYWQVWDNFMSVSLKVGRVSTAIHAMERIIEIRVDSAGAQAVDLDVLKRIINTIIRGQLFDALPPAEAEHKKLECDRYMRHLLVGTIEARITSSAPLWRAMADYWFWTKDYRHCLDCYIKAYRCLSQRPEITYAPPIFNDAAEAALELVSMYENVGDKMQAVTRVPTSSGGDSEQPDQQLPDSSDANSVRKAAAVAEPVCADWRHQAKMVLRGLIGKGKESFDGTPSYIRLIEALKELRQA
ncbi:hypothetical protein IW140_005903 [Coemansia sp. RSA 1813]|nr:hypothetical protein LPJ74_005258 [Coemansia sp. RSA 1843]KAJ2086257.1 hypothetical protein IW138_005814 [Coemansia sp. RSA 986]KAJ2210928.1 hypothetical protein EV179_005886 [Coemansia sp. RSA 487]KAJ2564019.1 hypothetical protein IW140_005903 [Coemansia sp. RSA 1813]